MPIAKIELPDGRVARFEVPEGTTPEQVTAFAEKQFRSKPTAPVAAPSKGKGGVAGGMFMGAIRDPLDAGAQLLVRGAEAVAGMIPDALGGETARKFMASEREHVDGIVKGANAEYEGSRKMAGRDGFDAARLTGNIVSPANLAVASRVAPLAAAKTLPALAGRGAAQGAAVASLQPVLDTDNFGTQKALQIGSGAVGGAVLTPVAAKAGEAILQAGSRLTNPARSGTFTVEQIRQIDDYVAQALKSNGIKDLNEVPQAMIETLREQARSALRAGQKLDPASLARKADFDAVGIQPTVGQLTRDPMQYARERNLRGVEGAGEKLTQRFSEQDRLLNDRLGGFGAAQAPEADVAGNALIRALQAADEPKKAAVTQAYQAARDATGRYANVDVPGFSKSANDALDSQMLGRFLPAEVKGLLNDISSGNLPLNVNNLVQVDSVMSSAQRAARAKGDEAAALAIGQVRDALNKADIESAAGAQAKTAFDAARDMARQRFASIENTPALKAALDGVDPDKFVRKYVINGSTNEVNALAKMLDPEAQKVARGQIAEYLRSKAFGANVTGDKGFSQEAYNKALNDLGTNKLAALFAPDEIAQLKALGRVAGYIHSQPSGSAVNNSNTAGAAMNLLSSLSGKIGSYPGLNLLRDSVRQYSAEKFANNALTGQLPKQASDLPPEVKNRLLSLIAPLQIGFASAVGSPAP